MSVTVDWYNEDHTAFYVSYAAGWTWDEHHKAVTQIQHLRQEHGLEKSYSIFDMRGTAIPIGSPVGPHYTEPPTGSLIVMVIDNMFTRTMIQITLRALRKNHLFHIVGTREEANAVIDAKLHPTEITI